MKKSVSKNTPPVLNVTSPSNMDGTGNEETNKSQSILMKVEETPNEDKLETMLIESGKISNFTLLPSDITKMWKSTRVKEEIVAFLQDKYKPKSQYDAEKVEYN